MGGWCPRGQNVHQQWHRSSGSKKSVTIPKEQSEFVYRRRTDNTIAKQKQKQKQKNNPRSTKHTHKTKNRVTRTLLKLEDELRCSGNVSSSCSTSDARRVNLVTWETRWYVMNEERTGKCFRQVEHIRLKDFLLNFGQMFGIFHKLYFYTEIGNRYARTDLH